MAGRLSPPEWPGLMRRKTAALYLELSEGKFTKLVAAQRIPASVLIDTERRWRKVDLDAFIATTSPEGGPSGTNPDFEERFAAFAAS